VVHPFIARLSISLELSMSAHPIRSLVSVVLAALSLTLLVPAAACAQSSAGSADPDTPAARRAAELVRAINTGRPDSMRAYAQAALAPAFLASPPLETHVEIWGGIYAQQGGFELEGIQGFDDGHVEARIRGRRTGDVLRLVVSVDPANGDRISGLGLQPVPPQPAQGGSPLTDEQIAAELDRHLAELAQRDVFAGTVLLAKGGQPFLHKAYGPADRNFGVPNRPDTKFNLGSMNKMFTAVAIAQLAEQGKLSFDDPIGKHLPAGSMRPEVLEKVKVEHLLTHTSGLGSYFSEEWDRQSRALYRTVDDWMPLVREDSLQFEPGTRWAYSNTGFLVLGKIVETASGQDYFDYVREHIFAPAGMKDTESYELDYVVENLAVGYERALTADGEAAWRNNIFQHVLRGGPAGGGYSTAADLLAFANALRSDRLVKRETRDRLWSPKPELQSPTYGYGFILEDDGNTVGHSGGFSGISSVLRIRLTDDLTIIALSNTGGGSQRVSAKLNELLARRAVAARR
jgi:CubicO group peptidase (beta-lactamase class C family)